MNKQIFSLYLLLALFVGVFTSCEDDSADVAALRLENGLLLVNQGNFRQSNGSLMFLPEGETTIQQDIFKSVNGSPIGGSIESVSKHNGKLYIVSNVIDKIVVTDAISLRAEQEIVSEENLTTPRYMVFGEGKAYVSVWGPYTNQDAMDFSTKKSKIAIIDLATQKIESTIAVPSKPEGMQLIGNKLYVAHTTDTLSVINTTSMEVEKKVKTPRGTSHFVKDAAGKLWVVHSGGWNGTEGYLIQYNQTTLAEENRITMPGIKPSGKTQLVGNVLYFSTSSALYKINLSAAAPAPQLVAERARLEIFWVNEANGDIYLGTSDSANPGTLIKLNFSGEEQQTYQLGPFPYQIMKL